MVGTDEEETNFGGGWLGLVRSGKVSNKYPFYSIMLLIAVGGGKGCLGGFGIFSRTKNARLLN